MSGNVAWKPAKAKVKRQKAKKEKGNLKTEM
jgi:hypothetical protein